MRRLRAGNRNFSMRTRLSDSVSGRYRSEENSLLTKHVVATGTFAKDAGSTPAASTIFHRENLRQGREFQARRVGGHKAR